MQDNFAPLQFLYVCTLRPAAVIMRKMGGDDPDTETGHEDMGTSVQGFLLSYLGFFLGAFQDFSGLSDLRDRPLKIGC